MSLPFKSALITGASAGIGKQYAIELAKAGTSELFLLARRTERLAALCDELDKLTEGKVKTQLITCDLLDAAQRKEVIQRFRAPEIHLDLLVNNAGFGSVGRFDKLDWQRQSDMVNLNCTALAHLAHGIIPGMAARGRGTIINVASTAAFQPLPFMSTYGATKAFVFSLSLALWAEYRRSGVHSIVHCPGPTESEFHIAAGLNDKIDLLTPMPTAPVVIEALQAAAGKRTVIVNGTQNRAMAFLTRFVPYSLLARIVAYKLGPYRGVGEPQAVAKQRQ
ncbi:MAG: SDR family oxidoreductase [Bdellovibrionales bacterium]|nr:SDR family oxidoreductase [Bdellovibrionales bacterium]